MYAKLRSGIYMLHLIAVMVNSNIRESCVLIITCKFLWLELHMGRLTLIPLSNTYRRGYLILLSRVIICLFFCFCEHHTQLVNSSIWLTKFWFSMLRCYVSITEERVNRVTYSEMERNSEVYMYL